MPDDAALLRVLGEIQRRGAIGPVALDEAIAHARHYVAACPSAATTLVDLGSGGGLPGLVIAVDRPDLVVTLVERRAKRADLLRFGVRALHLVERVTVLDADVDVLLQDAGRPGVDVVSARSFAPPLLTLRVAAGLLVPGGTALISDPPSGEPRWTEAELRELGMTDDGRVGMVHCFRRGT